MKQSGSGACGADLLLAVLCSASGTCCLEFSCADPKQLRQLLPVYKPKQREGTIERVEADGCTAICRWAACAAAAPAMHSYVRPLAQAAAALRPCQTGRPAYLLCLPCVCVCRGMFQKETDLALFTGSPTLPCPIVWGAGSCGACLRSTNPPGAMDNVPAPALLHKQPSCPRASLRFHFPCRHARHSCAWQAGGAHRGRVWKVGQVQSLLPGRRPSAAQARPAAAAAARRAAGGRGGTTSAATAAAPGGPLLQAIHV